MKSIAAMIALGITLLVWQSPRAAYEIISEITPQAAACGVLLAPLSFLRVVFGLTAWIYVGLIVVLILHAVLLILNLGLGLGARTLIEFSEALFNGLTWSSLGELTLVLGGAIATTAFISYLMKRHERPI